MVGPISNDKILPQTADRNTTSGGRRSEGQQGSSSSLAAPRSDDVTLELSSAGRLVNQEVKGQRSSGTINTAEQASTLVAKIRQQIEETGNQALKAHGQLESGQLTTLLESSAA